MKNHSKIDVEAAWGNLFLDFRRFGEWPKKQDFLMPVQWPKNPENRTRNGSKDAFPALELRQGYPAWRPWSLGQPRARVSHKLKA